ncbi:MAG: SH3 domain-containing protein [Flavobacteriales bacterium]|nr:SH3 domain-containing protein [Flavobacteriales bacterium]
MKKLLVILIAACTMQTAAQDNPKYLNVLATNGLNMRSKPETNARIITKVPFGKRVEVMEKTKAALQLGWIKDHWYRVQFRGREGYIFGGYLSELPAPKTVDNTTMLPDLLVSYCRSAFSTEVKPVSSIEPNKGGDTLYHILERYHGGIELEMEQQGNRRTVKLLLPADVEKSYVLLESLLKTGNKKEMLDQLRFVKGKDDKLSRISNAEGSIKVRKISDEQTELRLTVYAK